MELNEKHLEAQYARYKKRYDELVKKDLIPKISQDKYQPAYSYNKFKKLAQIALEQEQNPATKNTLGRVIADEQRILTQKQVYNFKKAIKQDLSAYLNADARAKRGITAADWENLKKYFYVKESKVYLVNFDSNIQEIIHELVAAGVHFYDRIKT